MSTIRFRNHRRHSETLLLEGPNYTGSVSCLEADIWRLLITHRPEDRQKGSWILEPQVPVALEVQEGDQGLVLQGNFPLEVQLRPFLFLWQGLQTLGLHSEPVRSLFQQMPKPDPDPHISHEHPVRDKLDGLPQGSGLILDLELNEGDAFYGLGERTGFLNKRGRRWHNWATDQFFHLPQADPLYQSHPFVMLCRDGQYCGLYLDESWYSCFDLGYTHPDQWSIHTAGPTFDLYLIPGPTPAEVIQRYTQLVGRAPMPPLWALGQHQCRWSYPDQEVVETVAQNYREHDLPLDALWLDIDYMDSYKVFTFSSRRFPDPADMVGKLAQQGIKTVVIVDPGVKQEAGYAVYETGRELDAFVHTERDEELVGEVWPRPVVWPDFSQPRVRQWWGEQHGPFLKLGIAGIWNDMNEPAAFKWTSKTLPLYARQGAYSHAELHNLYAYQMAQATHQVLKSQRPDQRPFVLTRSGCAGIQKYSWVWTGDNASYWEHLEMSIPMLLNLGLSGVPFVGADIGGFSGDCDGELLTAWSWLGVCYPLMRNHAGKGSRRQEPWQFGEPWLTRVRRALYFRYELLPYLYTLSWQSTQDGLPLMRPLLLDYPQDPEVLNLNEQFMLGADLLVAPILRPAQRHRLVYLPDGDWYDFWSGQHYRGGQWLQIQVSLDALPLFQRGGTAIPMQAPSVRPLHTEQAEWSELCWQIAPGKQIHGRVYRDSGNGPVDGQEQSLRGTVAAGQLALKLSPLAASASQHKVRLLGLSPQPQEMDFSGLDLQLEI